VRGQRLASKLPETMPRIATRSTTRPWFGWVVDLDGCGATRGVAEVRVGAALPSHGRSRWFEPNHAHSPGRRGQWDWPTGRVDDVPGMDGTATSLSSSQAPLSRTARATGSASPLRDDRGAAVRSGSLYLAVADLLQPV
jgi:hypothetical protein